MPPKNEKPETPKLRGERWELQDGREVVFLSFLGKSFTGRVYQVVNEREALEAVFESQFKKKLYPPPEGEMNDGSQRAGEF